MHLKPLQHRPSLAYYLRAALLIYLLGAAPMVASAEPSGVNHDLFALIAADTWVTPALGTHGALMADYRLSGLPKNMSLRAVYNTDTLLFGLQDLALSSNLWLGFYVKGELGFAGLLPDYYAGGERLAERGFQASYLVANGSLKVEPLARHYLAYEQGLKRWFFARGEETAESFGLPPETWFIEQRLHYTYWGLAADPSLQDSHRPTSRSRGLALGIDVDMDIRADARSWGAQQETRNRPQQVGFALRQWLRYGRPVMPWLRLQLAQHAGYGLGLDDLNRARIGGLNPYVVPVAGIPWAAFLSSNYAAVQLSGHFRIWREVEAGPWIDSVVMQDIHRTGAESYGVASGVGLFADIRYETWQFDIRGGWSPPADWQRAGPHLSFYVLVGKQIF